MTTDEIVVGQELEEENKNLSEGLRELIYKANTFAETAAQIIIQAYRYAIEVDKLQPQNAAKILKDNLVYSPQWINKQLPDEAKYVQKVPLKYSNHVKPVSHIPDKPKEVENITIPQREEVIQDAEIQKEDFFIPPNRFRKLFNDLMRFRQTAEKTGIYISSVDWQVRTG